MKCKLFCILMSVLLLLLCGCSDNNDALSCDNVTSFATAEEERNYWLTKNDYSPECDASGDPIETFNPVIDSNTYLYSFDVIIRRDVSLKGYEFTIEDFKGVENIESIGPSRKLLTKEEYKKETQAVSYEYYYNNFHQRITIYPKEKTVEKIKQMLPQLKKLPFIHDVAFMEEFVCG